MSSVNGHGEVMVETEMEVEAGNLKKEISKTGANGIHPKNGSVTIPEIERVNGKNGGASGGGGQAKLNGSKATGNCNGNGASAATDDIMNGIEEIKITAMDVDQDSAVVNANAPKTTKMEHPPAASVNPFSKSDNFSLKTEAVSEPANGVIVPATPLLPPIIQKCANSKLLHCTLESSASFPCKRCHRIFYCSEEHRQQHCKDHQADCKTVSSLEVINYEEEYCMWLKHAAPHLYDVCLNFVLVWPSLTAQWLPEVEEKENIIRHNLLLGTMTNQEQNHLLVCSIDMPAKTENNVNEHAAKFGGTLYVTKRINHEAEVNRARYMPQDYNIIATKSSSPEVFIFDLNKYPEVPEDNSFSPLLRLRGHQKEGFGLAWNLKDKGKLLSGSDDRLVCLWDLNKNPTVDENKVRFLSATRTFSAHEDVVEDVDWHPDHKHIFASVGDDKRLILWDTRVTATQETAFIRTNAHDLDINAVSFSPFSEFCLATGSSDTTVALWDMRNLSAKVHSFEYHKAEVMQVQWSPHSPSIIASTGKDNRVFVWDLTKLKDEGSDSMSQEDDPAPNELAFIHGGHIANVNDISWNQHEMGMIASVTEDNILQVWKISENLQAAYGEDDSDNESTGYMSETLDD